MKATGIILLAAIFFCHNTGFASEVKNDFMGYLSRPDEGAIFKQVTPGLDLVFPQDHLSHPGFKNEWWYLSGNLVGDDQRHYGFQWTLFRTALVVAGQPHSIFFAHAAIAEQQRFFYAERFARADMGHAGVTAQPWTAFIDGWQLKGEGEGPLPGVIKVRDKHFSYQLQLSASPYFLQGERGFSKKNQDASLASYYYNAPFVKVAGEIEIEGKPIAVTGEAWLDREWSTSLLSKQQSGWDWMSLHLNDSQALMMFRLRGAQTQYLYAVLMDKSGQKTIIKSSDLDWLGVDTETIDGHRYPVGWTLKIPKHNIDIEITPLNRRQQVKSRLGSYWEGAVQTRGTHESSGYVELSGY